MTATQPIYEVVDDEHYLVNPETEWPRHYAHHCLDEYILVVERDEPAAITGARVGRNASRVIALQEAVGRVTEEWSDTQITRAAEGLIFHGDPSIRAAAHALMRHTARVRDLGHLPELTQ